VAGGGLGPRVGTVIERTLIHVGGPRGSGKTTLVEAVLTVCDEMILVARCTRDGRRRQPRESAPRQDPELARYRAAGASGAARFSFPAGGEAADAFFNTALMSDFSHAVILEGDSPLPDADLKVFVAPAPRVGEALFVRSRRDPASADRARAGEWERLLEGPDGVARWMEQVVGLPVGEHLRRTPALAEEVRRQLLTGIASFRTAPAPRAAERWAVAERFAGIENAGLVVVAVHDRGERDRAEQLAADALRLRRDPALFNDILGWRGHRTPITAVAADLTDPRDLGRRKAVARIRRSLTRL
jgi:hypothetical protein